MTLIASGLVSTAARSNQARQVTLTVSALAVSRNVVEPDDLGDADRERRCEKCSWAQLYASATF